MAVPLLNLGSALKAWFDASDVSTITLSSGVSQWSDKSGNGFHATQATGANRPPGLVTINGLSAIKNTTSSPQAWLDLPDMSAFTAGTVCLVAQHTADPPGSPGPWIWCGTSGAVPHHPFVDGGIYDSFGLTGRYGFSYGSVKHTQPFIYSIRSSAGVYEFRLNGKILASSGTTVGFITNPRLFSNGAGHFIDGQMGELVLSNTYLSDQNLQEVEGYLAWKWGIINQTQTLPDNHPFRFKPPQGLPLSIYADQSLVVLPQQYGEDEMPMLWQQLGYLRPDADIVTGGWTGVSG